MLNVAGAVVFILEHSYILLQSIGSYITIYYCIFTVFIF